MTSAVFPKKKDPQRLNDEMREKWKNSNWSGMEFPVSTKNIERFEKQNPYAINGVDIRLVTKRCQKGNIQSEL